MKIVLLTLKYCFIVLIACSALIAAVGGGAMIYFSADLPNLITIEDYKPKTVTKIIGKGDIVVGEFFEERRYVIPYEAIPEHVIKAFVSAEDDRFFDHQGVDLNGIIRAAIANLKAGRVVQGGSTITQQVAKSLLLTPEKSFVRKAKELILASRMEKNLGKKQILYLYLNQIYLGQGAYGVEAAAKTYYNKSASELTVGEAAVLAGLPQAPSKYSPLINPRSAKQRQIYVLRRMMEDGVISKSEMETEVARPLRIYNPNDVNLKYGPYYVEHVRKYLLEKYGKEKLYDSGLIVKIPMDPNLAIVADKAIKTGLHKVDKKQGYRGPIEKVKEAAWENKISEIGEYNAQINNPYRMLMAEGTHSTRPVDLLEKGKPFSDAIDNEHLFKALVLKVEDSKKQVSIDLGIAQGFIPLDQMSWAQPVKTPSSTGVEPISRVSQALSKGDMIWVRYQPGANKNGEFAFSLEQIPMLQGALLSMDVQSGDVLSMVGGYSFKESEFNRAIQAERQNGSVYKPIIYSAALDKGYTPVTIIQDSPIVFNAGENEKWKPENFEEKFYGDTTFRSSLIKSRNIPTIKIVQDIQVSYLIDYSKRLGLPDKFNRDLSISLGSSTASLLDLSSVYAVFPRGGRKLKPIFISSVRDRDGNVLEEVVVPETQATPVEPVLPPRPKAIRVAGELMTEQSSGEVDPSRGILYTDPNDPERVLDPRTAYVMTHLMNEVATVGTGSQAKNLGRTAAGKTGTTNDYLDAWFMGFTPHVVTGVWIGFDTQKSIGPRSTGGTVALPIWVDFMKEAVKPYPVADFAVPKGIVFSFIDIKTGKLVGPNQSGGVREAFIEGSDPGSEAASSQARPASSQRAKAGEGQEEFFKEDIQ